MPKASNLMGAGCPALQAIVSVGIPTLNQTASGASQGSQATPSDLVVYTSSTLNFGPTLPADSQQMTVGDTYIICNHTANNINVWPPVGGKIGTGATNAAVSVPAGKQAMFMYLGTVGYYSYSLSN